MSRRLRILLLAAIAAPALAACASVRETAGNLWPFGSDRSETGAASGSGSDDGLIPVLGIDQAPAADAALASVAVTVPEAVALADWPHAGGVLNNAPQNVAGAGSLAVAFKRGAGDGAGRRGALIAPPIVADGRVYVLDSDLAVHAMDAASGRSVWRRSIGAPLRSQGWLRRPESQVVGGGIAFDAGRLFVATGAGQLVALDARNGGEVWRTTVDSPLHSAPLASGGRVFVTSTSSELFSMDQTTGAIQWSASALIEPARMLTAPSPALVGDTLVAPFASGEVVAFLVANGRRLWSEALTRSGAATSLSTIADISGRPVVVDGLVYAASQAGVLSAIDLRTGTPIWQQPIASIQTPWIAGDFLYAVATDGVLYCLDRKTGGVRWTRQLPRSERVRFRDRRITWTGPVMIGGRLVLGSSRGEILAVSAQDGSTLASREVGTALFIPPAVAGGTVYFYSNDAELIALR
jgi:outer membrane protein assembly factor BamB